jgi:signal transduction histidine kinase
VALATAALTTVVVVGVLAGPDRDGRAIAAIVNGLMVAVPMTVGLIAWRAQPDERFARLLVWVGAMFSLVALSQSADGTLYSIGRIAAWLVEPAVMYLMLVFPSGRLIGRWDRRLAVAVLLLVAVLYLPSVPIAEHFPEPSPWALCSTDCPPNAFLVIHVDQQVVADVRVLREVLSVLAVLAVAVSLAYRARRASGLLRRALVPVTVVAAFQVLAFGAYQWARRGGDVSVPVEVIGWLWLLSVPAVALSFGVGLLNRRLYVASALQRLTWDLRAPASSERLRTSLATALEDPGLRVVYWLSGEPGRWVDESGWPTAAPDEVNGKAVTEVRADGRRVAAVIHDSTLAPDSKLVQAAASYGLVVLENTRLIRRLGVSLRQLSEAEERTLVEAQRERQRIERDLHDGAQQRLLALRINLTLLGERLDRESPAMAAELESLADQIDVTIEDIRGFTHALAPRFLADQGIVPALRAAARDMPVRTSVEDGGVGRYPPVIEKAVYLACMEALQNAVKHAHSASAITIRLSGGSSLCFEIRDDGPGFDNGASRDGAGLENMRDRVAAVGGRLRIDSAPGDGTRVIGTIPIG